MPLFQSSFLQDTLLQAPFSPRSITLDNGVKMSLVQCGVLTVSPANHAENSKHIVISSAIHGNETAPIEILDDLVSQIEAQRIVPKQHLLLIIAHPQAILAKKRFIETNLNRLFSDANQVDTHELSLVRMLKSCVSQFWEGVPMQQRWHLDMHCSIRASKHYTFAISPQSSHPTRQKEFIEFLSQGHIEALLLSEEPSSTFSWFSSSQFGAQAATLELGQVAEFGHNDLGKLSQFKQALIALIMAKQSSRRHSMITYQVASSIYRNSQDFEFYFAQDLPNFSTFHQGEPLGKDGQHIIDMPIEGGGVVFPNPNVELSQRAALIVQPSITHYSNNQLTVKVAS
ncbi:succinylglutamate desuccinylase [Vibrio rarus]|uniref:succinylglutamate desuccinylase n=1 Tax=Vibrio rarus TaxID=413403 RepID=UPI0021C4545E|nr:succinylglutamate desuccinylase [Vibrio rarus]